MPHSVAIAWSARMSDVTYILDRSQLAKIRLHNQRLQFLNSPCSPNKFAILALSKQYACGILTVA